MIAASAWLAALPVLLALLLAGGEGGLWVKFVLAKFIYSTSDGAVLFFLGFVAVALVCARARVPARWSARASALTWGGLLGGHALHLAATLRYFSEYDIPFSAHVYHWSAGANSYNSLLHSHVGKAAMAPIAGLLPAGSHYDAGAALAGVVPGIGWPLGAAFVLAGIGLLLRMPVVFAAYGRRPALLLVFLIAAGNALKSLFDGGVLAYAVPPSLILLASFMRHDSAAEWFGFWRRHGVTLAAPVLGGYFLLWTSLTPGDEIPLAGPWLFFLVALLLLASGAWRGAVAWLARAMMIGYLLTNLLFDYGDNLAPLLRPLTDDFRIARFDDAGGWTPQAVETLGRQPVFRVYRALGDDPWKPRRVLIWHAAATGSRELAMSIRLDDPAAARGTLTPTPALRIAGIGARNERWLTLNVATGTDALPPLVAFGIGNALSKNNYYVWLYQIDRMLRQGGWQSYVMLPHTAGNPAADAAQ